VELQSLFWISGVVIQVTFEVPTTVYPGKANRLLLPKNERSLSGLYGIWDKSPTQTIEFESK
jgi:hypothetical protein